MNQSLLDTLKQAREALERLVPNTEHPDWITVVNLTAAIAELEKAEPAVVLLDGVVVRCDLDRKFSGKLYIHPSDDAKLREDAARYRWLRNQPHAIDWDFDPFLSYPHNGLNSCDLLDAAIDAARAAEGGR